MAQYATSVEFAALGLPAAALDGFAGDPDDFLTSASGQIDTYLRGRYRLPLGTPYPQELVRWTCHLAAFDLLSVRGFNPESGAHEVVRLRHQDTMKELRALSKGQLNLDVLADATPAAHDGGPIVSSRVRNTSLRFRDDC